MKEFNAMAIILNLPDVVVPLSVRKFHLLQLKVATW
jgi:hypothetical protein